MAKINVVFSKDGSDMAQAMQACMSGAATLPELADWTKARDQWLVAMSPKSTNGGELTCKISEVGAVSVYGLNARFPVTLYAEQWRKLAKYMTATLLPYIEANNALLSQGKTDTRFEQARQVRDARNAAAKR